MIINNNLYIQSLVNNKNVLFVNSIRSDVPSGGNTATKTFLSFLKTSASCHELSLSQRVSNPIFFSITTFPAVIFIFLLRATRNVWLEFLIRFSPLLFIRCIWECYKRRPDIVIFNHHASFLYVFAFWGCKKLFVWHDVPSLKTVANAKLNKNRVYCAFLQKLVLKRSDFNVTFSFHDSKFLSFFHGYNSAVMPVILKKASLKKRVQIKQSWLLTGNWHRAENCEGARIFLIECFNLISNFKSNDKPALAFNFAGYGADLFINNLFAVFPELRSLDIVTTSEYSELSEFDEIALIAPLLSGAGIKLKTIEAWSHGIPVIGTPQAFSGLPKDIWSKGGVRLSSIKELAHFCITPDVHKEFMSDLTPDSAFIAYANATQCH